MRTSADGEPWAKGFSLEQMQIKFRQMLQGRDERKINTYSPIKPLTASLFSKSYFLITRYDHARHAHRNTCIVRGVDWCDRVRARQARSELALVGPSFCFVRGCQSSRYALRGAYLSIRQSAPATPGEEHLATTGFSVVRGCPRCHCNITT
jgi:hypothetical protein